MTYSELLQHFLLQQVISSAQIRNYSPSFSSVQLSRWVKQGKLIQLRRGKYLLPHRQSGLDRELLANELKNSYISLEYAMNYYGLIPEVPQKTTSITTGRNEVIQTPFGVYSYYRIQPSLYLGYELVNAKLDGRQIKIASFSKSLFDYLYFHPVKTKDELYGLRLNWVEIKEQFKIEQFKIWIDLCSKTSDIRRLHHLAEILNHA